MTDENIDPHTFTEREKLMGLLAEMTDDEVNLVIAYAETLQTRHTLIHR